MPGSAPADVRRAALAGHRARLRPHRVLGSVALVRFRTRQRRSELRDLWPEVVDNLAPGVRAALSLPEALTT